MKNIWFVILLMLAGCAVGKHPALVKYEAAVTEADARAARGEITQLEAENLKLAANQDYVEARRRQERQLDEDAERLIKNQNQDINAVSRQFQ